MSAMKILFLLLTAMFLFFASLQVNDPDPVVWILIYGSMAVVCVLAAFRIYVRWLMALQAAAYIIYCVLLAPSLKVWWNSGNRSELFSNLATMSHLYIEESREFLGLVICLVALLVVFLRSRR